MAKKKLLSDLLGLKRRHPYPRGTADFLKYCRTIERLGKFWYWKQIGWLPGCQFLFRLLWKLK